MMTSNEFPYRCPACGQRDHFHVKDFTGQWFDLDEGGACPVDGSTFSGDIEWDENSAARCPDCDYSGLLGEFYELAVGEEQEDD
jgi:DNA-directed RNA polymerase subunit RPC12/RpoP